MKNKIDQIFEEKKSHFRFMAHTVAGFPTLEESEKWIKWMGDQGIDLIEIQIPFSDPMADGPTIMEATQLTLDQGITPPNCFKLIKNCTDKMTTPVVLMTYYNILHNMGIQEFIKQCFDSSVSGIIVPDLPFDTKETELFYDQLERHDIFPVQVVSPGMSEERLKGAISCSKGFVYATLKIGITGATKNNEESGEDFLKRLKKVTDKPVLAGFGISSGTQILDLKKKCDGFIVGSHLIDLYNDHGIDRIKHFIKSIQKTIIKN